MNLQAFKRIILDGEIGNMPSPESVNEINIIIKMNINEKDINKSWIIKKPDEGQINKPFLQQKCELIFNELYADFQQQEEPRAEPTISWFILGQVDYTTLRQSYFHFNGAIPKQEPASILFVSNSTPQAAQQALDRATQAMGLDKDTATQITWSVGDLISLIQRAERHNDEVTMRSFHP